MFEKKNTRTAGWQTWLGTACLSLILLAGCNEPGSEMDDKSSTPQSQNLKLSLDLPDSLTGGSGVPGTAQRAVLSTATIQAISNPCAYQGAGNDDPFKNGYNMTKFMVSSLAAWTCIGDTLIDVADFIPHDGTIYESDNDTLADNYDPDDPTHYSVTDDSENQTTIRLFYGFDRAFPPLSDDEAKFYISWSTAQDGTVTGRLIVDASGIDAEHRNPEDPAQMRMDFNYTETENLADMYLRFDAENPWANGFRIQVSEDLTANPLQKVFLARGLMDVKRQFQDNTGIEELPTLQMYTVANQLGDGAAIAHFQNVALSLELNAELNNHLGNYLFDKRDKYFFDADQSVDEPWDWINKAFTSAVYRGGRTTPEINGSWIPFNPSLDMIIDELNLDADYFTNAKCENTGDDCTALLDAVFAEGFADQEPNQGQDPQDWRSDAVADPQYLDSVYPNGNNWDGAFDHSFMP
jgi:hypothetical protein